MKNLKPHIDILEDPDDIISILDKKPLPWWERCNLHSENHKVENVYPLRRVQRIAKSYIGKPFDDAFSKYCKEVPKYQQHIFLEEFTPKNYHYWRYKEYIVDGDGNIQLNEPKKDKKRYIYRSDDFRTEKRHKKTGKKYPEYYWFRKGIKESDYHYVIVAGYELEFDSKTPEYRRLITEQLKRREIRRKEEIKAKNETAYSFLTNAEKEQIKEKKTDYYKILKHGFDPETSFRGNSVNPDIIKDKRGY